MPTNFAFVSLKEHGYRAADDRAKRRLALETAFNHLSSKQKDEMVLHDLSRSLLNLARLHKNRNPHHSAVYTEDANWVSELVAAKNQDKRPPHDKPGKRPRDDSDDDDDRPGKRPRDIPAQEYDSDFWESKYDDVVSDWPNVDDPSYYDPMEIDAGSYDDPMEIDQDEPKRGKKRRGEEDQDRVTKRPKFNPRQGQKRPLDETELEPIKRPRTGPHRPNKRALDETELEPIKRPRTGPHRPNKRPLEHTEDPLNKRPRTGPHRPNKRPNGLDDFIEGVDQASGKKQKFGKIEVESDDEKSDEDMEEILGNKRGGDRSRPIFSVPSTNGSLREDDIERILAEKRAQQDRKHSRPAFAVNVPQIEEAVYSQPIEIDPYEEPTRKRGRDDEDFRQSKRPKTQPLPLPNGKKRPLDTEDTHDGPTPKRPKPAAPERKPKRARGAFGGNEEDINSLPNRRPKLNPAVEPPRAIPIPAVVRPKRNRTGPVTLNEARQLIGVQPGATEQQIERAFRAVSRREHPDKGGDTAYYQAILDARQILKINILTGRGFFEHALSQRYRK